MYRAKKIRPVVKGLNIPTRKIKFNAQQIYRLALLGLSESEITETLDVDKEVMARYKKMYPNVAQAFRKGAVFADSKVAHAHYKSALGFKYKEQQIITNRVKKTTKDGVKMEYTEPILVEVEKLALPNVRAQMNWLEKRKPEQWSAKELGKPQGSNPMGLLKDFDLSKLSVSELKQLLTLLDKGRGVAQKIETVDAKVIEDE